MCESKSEERLACRWSKDDSPLRLCYGRPDGEFDGSDLDPFYWLYTSWYALTDDERDIRALVLGYFASHAVFLAYASPGEEPALAELVEIGKTRHT